MSDEDCKCPECPAGLPGWLATFADLMSLLMCFFVLLLSFSEMDAQKFRRLAGSMAAAFGVQQQLEVMEVPKGTSIIAQEFSPSRPEPTPINEIYQKTDNLTELSLEVKKSEEYDSQRSSESEHAGGQQKSELMEKIQKLVNETQQDAQQLASALSDQIASGEVEIESHGRQIIIRIREKGSFSSGSADLALRYIPILRNVRNVLVDKPGTIAVEGHTDNVPISTARFRSNWELSSARAVSVAHELVEGDVLDPTRIHVSGFADTRPLESNDSSDGRARNRRVEIVVRQSVDQEIQNEFQELKIQDPELYEKLDLDEAPRFKLKPEDIF